MKLLIFIGVCVVAMFIYDIAHTFILARKSGVLIKNATPFTRNISDAEKRILILGDSTAYGTGTQDNQYSTAGRLGALYPNAYVQNLAVNGLKIDGLLKILETLPTQEHFDIILIQIGANDVIRLTSMDKIEQGITEVLKHTQGLGDQVIVLHSGNIGESRFFPWYLKPLLSQRSFKIREIYKTQTSIYSAKYVDLIDSPASVLLRDNPQKYYAPDFLHLSNEGYGLWFDEIQKQLKSAE